MTCLVWAAVFAMFVVVLLGYFLGCLNGSVLVSHFIIRDDVRQHGSGNAGMTNVLRTYGKLPAVFTTLGDVGKSVAAVNLGRFIFGALLSGTGAAWQNPLDPVCGAYLAAIFCMIGHSRPIFFGFKGGKGVLVGVSVFLGIDWKVFLCLIVIFAVVLAISKYVSLGSIVASVCCPIVTFLFQFWQRGDLPMWYLWLNTGLAALMGAWSSGCTAPISSGSEPGTRISFRFIRRRRRG